MPNPYDDFDGTPQRRQLTGADPTLPARTATANNQAAASNYAPGNAAAELRIKQLEAQIKSAEANSAGAMSQAELEKARLDVQKAQAELAALKTGKNTALDALQGQVDRVNQLYTQNLKDSPYPNVFNNLIPDFMQSGMGAFDTAGEGLANPFLSAFRVPGAGSQSDTELKQFISANVPTQGDSNATIEEKLGNIQRRIDAERGMDKSSALPGMASPQEAQMGLAQGGTQSVIDPARQAIGARIGQMIAQGKSRAEIERYMIGAGVSPSETNLTEAIRFRATPDFKAWQRANPGKPYPIGADFYTKDIPMSETRQLVNKISQSAPATAVMMAGNAISGDRLANFSANPEMARAGMDLARANNPTASLVGDMAGQAMLEGSVNRIPFMRGLMGSTWGRRGAEALYGAYSGSGQGDVSGGALGAVTNVLGGGAGRRLQGALGGAFTGVRNPDLQYLNERNVPLTLGQIGRGSDSILGRTVGGIEERAMGLPGFDAVIGTARRRGDEGFNRAAFGEAFDTLGKPNPGNTGAAGVADLASARRDAYSFLDPINMPVDAQFAGSQAGIRAAVPQMPAQGNVVTGALDQIDRSMPNAQMSGRAWQDNVRLGRADRASIAGQPGARQATEAFDQMGDNLFDLAARQGPAGTADNLARANRFNQQAETLVSALDNGPAQKADELFSPSRLDDASRAGTRKFGGRWASIGGNRPFYELTSAGKNVMPNLTPDSGSIGRLAILPVATGGIGALSGAFNGEEGGLVEGGTDGLTKGAAILGGLSALYSKPGQKMIQKALLGPRSPLTTKIGEALLGNRSVGGKLGAALMRDLALYPELYPSQ